MTNTMNPTIAADLLDIAAATSDDTLDDALHALAYDMTLATHDDLPMILRTLLISTDLDTLARFRAMLDATYDDDE